MADQIKPESLPAKRKLALTEDEHQLIETYRLKNLAVDAWNEALDKATTEALIIISHKWDVETDDIDALYDLIRKALIAVRKPRVSPL